MKTLPTMTLLALWSVTAAGEAFAQAADDRAELARELGSVLAWRLMPEVVETQCRGPDPECVEARQKALQNWRDKHAALIQSVDDHVAEIVPLAFPGAETQTSVEAIRRQVGDLLQESMFAGRSDAELKQICEAERDPASPNWNSNGMPHVQEALAALYDWKVRHAAE